MKLGEIGCNGDMVTEWPLLYYNKAGLTLHILFLYVKF